MPSVLSPPGTSRASKTTTSWPEPCAARGRSSGRRARSRRRRPACPVGGPGSKNCAPLAVAASQACRCSRPIWTGAFSSVLIDAGPFAEHLGRAGAGAAAAEDVGVEDRPGRPEVVAVEDLADELGDVDVRRAGPGARGVEAEEAARGLDQRLVGRRAAAAGRRNAASRSRAQYRSPALGIESLRQIATIGTKSQR